MKSKYFSATTRRILIPAVFLFSGMLATARTDPGSTLSVSNPPVVTLTGPNTITNEAGTAFTDPGATASASPRAIAAGGGHFLALKDDGIVAGWGNPSNGQINTPASANEAVSIAAGAYHSLALKNDGTVVGWGWNYYGQISIPESATNVVAISLGDYHGLALKADGTVVAWGFNGSDNRATPPASATNVVGIASGSAHNLALKSNGTIVAWGNNSYGQINVPASATNIVAVAAGSGHSLALKADGTVIAWGNNGYSQCNVPASATNVVAIAAGYRHSMALKADGTVIAWGDYYSGYGQSSVPASATNIVAIAANYYNSLALRADGTVIAWGDNSYGQLNVPAGVRISLPVTVSGTVNADVPGNYTLTYSAINSLGSVATATRRVVIMTDATPPVIALNGADLMIHASQTPFVDPGVTATDTVDANPVVTTNSNLNVDIPGTYTIIYTATDSSGNTATTKRRVVVLFAPSPVVTMAGPDTMPHEWGTAFKDPGTAASAPPYAIAAGAGHSLALKADGTVAAWGQNNDGQINMPASATNLVAIASIGWHNMALKPDGTVIAWGRNNEGQTNVPATATNVVAIAAGCYNSLALKADGTIVAWGSDSAGQTTVPFAAANVTAVSAGFFHSLALKADGTIVAWGDNGYGQINIPPSATNVTAIAAGWNHNLALAANGTVIAWGDNSYGQTNVPASATNVLAIAAGASHSLALKADGSVIAWGDNLYGKADVPTSVTNGVAIAAGASHSLAMRADGTIIGWGWNYFGQLDAPETVRIDFPVGVNGVVNTNLLGSYTLTYSTTNNFGAVGTATRTVVVVHTEPPVIALNGTNPILLTCHTAFADPGATATDAYDGNCSVISSNNVNSEIPGLYTITYRSTDSASNTATVIRRVMVFPTPVITLTGPSTVTNEWGAAFDDPGAAASASLLGISAGDLYSIGLKGDGTIVAWGDYDSGRTAVSASASNIIAIAAGGHHGLALKKDGRVIAWGGYFPNNFSQTDVPALATNVVAIAAGKNHSLALKNDGTVVAWGGVDDGTVISWGEGFPVNYGQGVVPDSAVHVIAVAAGERHSLILKSNGKIIAWGNNDYGQTNVPALAANIVGIAAGWNHNLALKADGTVIAWGRNNAGQTNVPASATNVAAISAGIYHSLALRADGSVVAWGGNGWGQTNVPASATNVMAITAGSEHNLALRADGTIIAWGNNYRGQINVPAGLSNLPVRVSGLTNTILGPCTVTYSAINLLGSMVTTTRTVVVEYPAYAQWCVNSGLPGDESGEGDPAAAPAGDGIQNLMKYALGITATAYGNQGHFASSITNASNSIRLMLTYTRPDPAPDGITYTAEATSTLVPALWSNDVVEVSRIVTNGWCTVTIRDAATVTTNAHRFLRLRVQMSR